MEPPDSLYMATFIHWNIVVVFYMCHLSLNAITPATDSSGAILLSIDSPSVQLCTVRLVFYIRPIRTILVVALLLLPEHVTVFPAKQKSFLASDIFCPCDEEHIRRLATVLRWRFGERQQRKWRSISGSGSGSWRLASDWQIGGKETPSTNPSVLDLSVDLRSSMTSCVATFSSLRWKSMLLVIMVSLLLFVVVFWQSLMMRRFFCGCDAASPPLLNRT